MTLHSLQSDSTTLVQQSTNSQSSLAPLLPRQRGDAGASYSPSADAANPSTGIPITFGSVCWYTALMSGDGHTSRTEVLPAPRNNHSVNDGPCENCSWCEKIKYVVNMHPHHHQQAAGAPPYYKRRYPGFEADEVDDIANMFVPSPSSLSTQYYAASSLSCILPTPTPSHAAATASPFLDGSPPSSMTQAERENLELLDNTHTDTDIGFAPSSANCIIVDTTIALKYAQQETTALKNRMILCGLTLTIPLFLYLRFTIWRE